MFHKEGVFLAALLALGGAVSIALAGRSSTGDATNGSATIVVPNAYETVEGGTALPNATDQHRVMFVYDASQFAVFGGPVDITALAFRANSAQAGPGTLIEHNMRVFLSTTPMSPATLSATFADNIGPDYTLVTGEAIVKLSASNKPGSGSTQVFAMKVPFETPFRYDPAVGNLLVEIQTGPPAPEGIILFDSVAGDPMVSQVYASGSSTAESGEAYQLGFVLQFTIQQEVTAP